MPDLEGRPRVQVLGEPAEVDEEELERAVHAGQVVVGGDASVGVVLDLGEAQELGHRGPVQREAGGRDRGGAHARHVGVAARLAQALHVAQKQLDEGAEVVPVGRRLRRLAVRVGDHEGPAVRLRHLEQGRDRPEQVGEQGRQALLERHLEHRVVDVVPAPARVELARRLDAEPPLELGLDQEEEVLVLAGVGQRRDVDAPLDVVEGPQDRRRLGPREEPLRGQHDRAGAVDPHLLPPVMLLHALEERGEDGLPVDRRRELLLVARAGHASLDP